MAAGVAGEDEVKSVGKCTAMYWAVAGKGAKHCRSFQIPDFHRGVFRS